MMKRKIFALLLAILTAAMLPLYASADAYIPPEEPVYGYDILSAHEFNGTCKPLNTFLSNFAEMGLESYYLDTPDEEVIACVLKHIELNAGYYPSDVSRVDGNDGNTYMQLTESLFNTRMKRLFARDIPAWTCPGYENGSITVTANRFGGPIDIIANVNSCYWAGDTLYEVFFDVYYIHTDFSGWYNTAYYNLPQDNLTHRGTGRAIISYAGGQTTESISTSHFTLVEWQMDAWGIAGPGNNLPYGYVEETLPPETEVSTEAPTQTPTEAPTEPETIPETEPVPTQAPENQKDEPADEPNALGGISSILLIIALVVIAVLLAAVLLLLIALKKKKS